MTELAAAGVRLRVVATTGSTNADLLASVAADEQLAEGEWLLADRQTAGRGRQGREWRDGLGNFMGSTAIRLRHGDPPPASLSLVAGLALHETAAQHLPARTGMLKWPNDLMAGGAKLAGILLERIDDWIIAGVGVNLTSAPELPGRRTVALSAYGPAPERDVFAANLALHFSREVARWRTYGLGPVIHRWLAAAHPAGTALTVQRPGETLLQGRFAGLNDDGSLRLALADGTVCMIAAGEVMLAGGN